MDRGIRRCVIERLGSDGLVESGQLVDDIDPGALVGSQLVVEFDNGAHNSLNARSLARDDIRTGDDQVGEVADGENQRTPLIGDQLPKKAVLAGVSLASESNLHIIIAWSIWRRAHQAAAQRTHFKAKRER